MSGHLRVTLERANHGASPDEIHAGALGCFPVENSGIGGEETTGLARRFEVDVLSLQPDVVVILGGINDINRRGVADPRHVFEMVERALAANAKVIVGTLPPAHGPGLNDEKLGAELIRSFNEELFSASRSYGYEVADFYTAMIREGIPDDLLFKDGVHPNGFGYARMWAVLRTVLAKNDLLLEPPSK